MPGTTVDDGHDVAGKHSRATSPTPGADAGAVILRLPLPDPVLDAAVAHWADVAEETGPLAVPNRLPEIRRAPGTRSTERTDRFAPFREAGAAPAELDPALRFQAPDEPRIAALLRLAQRGDGEAFGRIYDRYVDQVYRYLYYRLGSHALAEDLTSETFLRALRRINSFTWQGRDIGAWFIIIARNLVNDHLRSSRSRPELPAADLSADLDHADEGIDEVHLGPLHSAVVLEAMRELKPEQQECLILRFLQGLSVTEAAHVMDRSEAAIKLLQLRAIGTLARVLSRRNHLARQSAAQR